MLELYDVGLAHRLRHITMKIEEGSLVHFVGPNGSGKSSLISVMSGLEPFNGQLHCNGERIDKWSLSELATYRGYLAQYSRPQFDLSVLHYINTVIHRLNVSSETAVREVLAILDDFLHFSHLFSSRVNQLSGGEWQRVRLACIFLQAWPTINPNMRYLLLDEPATGLDIYHQKAVTKITQQLTRAGLTVVVVSHDLNDSLMNADRVAVLTNSKLYAFGASEHVLTPQTLHDVFNVEAKLHQVASRSLLVW
ncbi:ATP-binding cassette domain-containing protein [Thaumasiovibrio sp. DFM-14]|uniref:ATP-binding cassette domain-containing protein n=1 Tax=Thaumasiovibrio sp. DFM-14 TaxID=3384792 RepID=UPI0039A3E573